LFKSGRRGDLKETRKKNKSHGSVGNIEEPFAIVGGKQGEREAFDIGERHTYDCRDKRK
jgi:hypothetical protein